MQGIREPYRDNSRCVAQVAVRGASPKWFANKLPFPLAPPAERETIQLYRPIGNEPMRQALTFLLLLIAAFCVYVSSQVGSQPRVPFTFESVIH